MPTCRKASTAAASTLAAVSQQVGLALGVSFGGVMLHLARGADGALTPDRFVLPFVAIGLVTLLALPVYLALDKDAGSAISGGTGRPSPSVADRPANGRRSSGRASSAGPSLRAFWA
jgi:hypothetical protein